MSYEPRMRGTRSRRAIRKKQTAKENKNEFPQPHYYEDEEVDPQIIISNILNGIDHLGNQRFGLPPFNEHFQRWRKDVSRLTTEFQTQFPNAADQQFHSAVDGALTSLNQAFTQRANLESAEINELTALQQQLTKCELSISKLEHEHNKQTSELRKKFEQKSGQLQDEIDSLDRQRLSIIRKRVSFLQRILRRPEAQLEESNNLIQSKKEKLREVETTLKQNLSRQREHDLANQKDLLEEREALRNKIATFKENRTDDALEIRTNVCKQLHQAIADAVERAEKQQTPQT
jgi:DNA repair exonuclease SbcCD ATPase subunit